MRMKCTVPNILYCNVNLCCASHAAWCLPLLSTLVATCFCCLSLLPVSAVCLCSFFLLSVSVTCFCCLSLLPVSAVCLCYLFLLSVSVPCLFLLCVSVPCLFLLYVSAAFLCICSQHKNTLEHYMSSMLRPRTADLKTIRKPLLVLWFYRNSPHLSVFRKCLLQWKPKSSKDRVLYGKWRLTTRVPFSQILSIGRSLMEFSWDGIWQSWHLSQ